MEHFQIVWLRGGGSADLVGGIPLSFNNMGNPEKAIQCFLNYFEKQHGH